MVGNQRLTRETSSVDSFSHSRADGGTAASHFSLACGNFVPIKMK
jgi:hypothetical protein